MSGASYESYSHSYGETKGLYSSSAADREKAYKSREERLATSRSEMSTKSATSRERRDDSKLYDQNLIRRKIAKPNPKAKTLHIVMIDNSGSNRVIAEHLKSSSGYLTSVLKQVDPTSQIAFMYCSDHGDGENFIQEVDFLYPDKEGDKALYSTIKHTSPANGFDAPEGFECALLQASKINFGDAKKKHLYLVTDVVAHGMGMAGDDGCPHNVSWEDSVKKVNSAYDSFEVVGCGNDPGVVKLQEKFLKKNRVAFDLIDLSGIPESEHRTGITGNALLFLIARHTGQQGVELFLTFLYEKWLKEALFGALTDQRAQKAIRNLAKYLEYPDEDIAKMLKKIFCIPAEKEEPMEPIRKISWL